MICIVFKVHFHAAQGRRQGYILQQDGRLLPYSHICDHIAPMSGHLTQSSGLGIGTSGLPNGAGTHVVRRNDNMGIDPMQTIGVPPSYIKEEPEPQADVQKKPGSRARSAGTKVKTEVLASSPVKATPSRRGRPPASPKKAAASAPTTPKRATSPRKPVSRAASPKKAATAKPVSAAASTSASTSAANRPPVSASSPRKPYFGVAPIPLPGLSAKPVSAPAPSQGSPVRLTRSATREGTAALPPQHTPTGYQAPNAVQAARPLPTYAPPASQPVAGPSSVPMEHVPKTGYPAGQSGYASPFAQAFYQWPMPVLVPAAWIQHQSCPQAPATRAQASASDEKMEED